MVTDSDFFDSIGMEITELAAAVTRMDEALKLFGKSVDPNESAFALVNETDLSNYQLLSQHPECARRFGAGMRCFSRCEDWHMKHLVSGFDSASINHPGAVVVDIGDGVRSVLQYLAKSIQHVKFVV